MRLLDGVSSFESFSSFLAALMHPETNGINLTTALIDIIFTIATLGMVCSSAVLRSLRPHTA
jgi:hypothetical protein